MRARRRELGLAASDLGRPIGKADVTVRAHETGQNRMTAEIAAAYAEVLQVTPAWLLYGEGSAPPPVPVAGAAQTQLTVDAKGHATLVLNEKLPMGVALEILRLIEGAKQGG